MAFFIAKRLRFAGITIGYSWRPKLGRVARAAHGAVASPATSPLQGVVIFIVLVVLFVAMGHC